MCTKYWLPIRRSKPAQKSVVSLTDCPDMTIDVYRDMTIDVYRDMTIDVYRDMTIDVYRDMTLDVYRDMTIDVYRESTTTTNPQLNILKQTSNHSKKYFYCFQIPFGVTILIFDLEIEVSVFCAWQIPRADNEYRDVGFNLSLDFAFLATNAF